MTCRPPTKSSASEGAAVVDAHQTSLLELASSADRDLLPGDVLPADVVEAVARALGEALAAEFRTRMVKTPGRPGHTPWRRDPMDGEGT